MSTIRVQNQLQTDGVDRTCRATPVSFEMSRNKMEKKSTLGWGGVVTRIKYRLLINYLRTSYWAFKFPWTMLFN